MKCNHFYDAIQDHHQVKLGNHCIIMTSYAPVSSKINLSGVKDEKLLLKESFVKDVLHKIDHASSTFIVSIDEPRSLLTILYTH